MKPKDVKQKHVRQILDKINKVKLGVYKPKFKVGDSVRISKTKGFSQRAIYQTGQMKF